MNKLFFVILFLFMLSGLFWYLNYSRDREKMLYGKEDLVVCVSALYSGISSSGEVIDSQCLGTCGDYAVDVVHVPRRSSDDLPENQCSLFLNGSLKKFVEIDSSGKIIRISE